MNWNKFEEVGPPEKGVPCWYTNQIILMVSSGLISGLTYMKLLYLGVLLRSA